MFATIRLWETVPEAIARDRPGALQEQPCWSDEASSSRLEFLEVSKRIINEVPHLVPHALPRTINAYRGCSHACTLLLRGGPTHGYLDLDPGKDSETKIVVKTNAVELARAETAPHRWRGRSHRDGDQHRPISGRRGQVPADPGDQSRCSPSGITRSRSSPNLPSSCAISMCSTTPRRPPMSRSTSIGNTGRVRMEGNRTRYATPEEAGRGGRQTHRRWDQVPCPGGADPARGYQTTPSRSVRWSPPAWKPAPATSRPSCPTFDPE